MTEIPSYDSKETKISGCRISSGGSSLQAQSPASSGKGKSDCSHPEGNAVCKFVSCRFCLVVELFDILFSSFELIYIRSAVGM
jgi:hypothetical protein